MTVIADWVSGYESRAEALESKHTFVGDEPVSLGGADRGPSPLTLLDASLAT